MPPGDELYILCEPTSEKNKFIEGASKYTLKEIQRMLDVCQIDSTWNAAPHGRKQERQPLNALGLIADYDVVVYVHRKDLDHEKNKEHLDRLKQRMKRKGLKCCFAIREETQDDYAKTVLKQEPQRIWTGMTKSALVFSTKNATRDDAFIQLVRESILARKDVPVLKTSWGHDPVDLPFDIEELVDPDPKKVKGSFRSAYRKTIKAAEPSRPINPWIILGVIATLVVATLLLLNSSLWQWNRTSLIQYCAEYVLVSTGRGSLTRSFVCGDEPSKSKARNELISLAKQTWQMELTNIRPVSVCPNCPQPPQPIVIDFVANKGEPQMEPIDKSNGIHKVLDEVAKENKTASNKIAVLQLSLSEMRLFYEMSDGNPSWIAEELEVLPNRDRIVKEIVNELKSKFDDSDLDSCRQKSADLFEENYLKELAKALAATAGYVSFVEIFVVIGDVPNAIMEYARRETETGQIQVDVLKSPERLDSAWQLVKPSDRATSDKFHEIGMRGRVSRGMSRIDLAISMGFMDALRRSMSSDNSEKPRGPFPGAKKLVYDSGFEQKHSR